MSLKERLLDDMKAAMKEREEGKLRLSVIRMMRAAVQTEEIALGKELSEDEIIGVLAREAKKRKEAMVEYSRAGRDDAAHTLAQEVQVIEQYLPQQLSEDEVKQIVSEAIAELGPDLGSVMKHVMARVKGRADGKMVNQIVRSMIS